MDFIVTFCGNKSGKRIVPINSVSLGGAKKKISKILKDRSTQKFKEGAVVIITDIAGYGLSTRSYTENGPAEKWQDWE